jgi:outer membrane murein-binding lipoprotein Lpp
MIKKIGLLSLAVSAVLLTGCSSSKVDELDLRVTKLETQVAQQNAQSSLELQQLKMQNQDLQKNTERTNGRLNKLRDSLRDD